MDMDAIVAVRVLALAALGRRSDYFAPTAQAGVVVNHHHIVVHTISWFNMIA